MGQAEGRSTCLVAQSLPEVFTEFCRMQRAFVLGVQLLEAVQEHDSFLTDKLLGVTQQLHCRWQHRIDQIGANQLAGGCQGCADCKPHSKACAHAQQKLAMQSRKKSYSSQAL